jgi:hypothetical protein
MAAPTLIRRELLGARIYFIPTGESVDSATISKTLATWPDVTPATNWTNYLFADIEKVTEFKSENTEKFMVPDDFGGYNEDEEISLVARGWEAETAKTNSILKTLQHAVPNLVAASVAQAPGTRKANSIEGIALVEMQGKDGAVKERTQVWARLTLVSPGDVGPATRKLRFRLLQIAHVNNTYQAYA